MSKISTAPEGLQNDEFGMYNALKTDLTGFLGLTKDALHIHIGLAIFLGLLLLLKRSPASLLPWFGLLGLELINEFMDLFHRHAGAFSFELGDSLKDIANTMLWPTIVLICFRVGSARKARAVCRDDPAGAG